MKSQYRERKNQERLELALKASNEGIWDWDFTTGEIYYSNRVLMFLGYGLIGAPNIFAEPEDHVHPDDLREFERKLDRVVSRNGRLFALEPRIRTNGGEWKWFRVRAVAVRDQEGTVVRMVGSLIDISKRKFAERDLADERGLIDLVLDNVPVNVYFKDKESRFVRANVATAERMGAGTVAELIGKTDHEFFDPEHADAAREKELEIMATGVGQEEKLEHEIWEGGKDSWVLVTNKIWHGMEGEVRGTFGVTHDVTELMVTQGNLVRVAEQLQRVNQDISEERHLLRLVIDNIPMFVYFKDVNSRFVLVNKGMSDLVGVSTPDEVVGMHDRDFFTQDLFEASGGDERRIMETGQPVIKKLEKLSWKDQHVTWCLTSKFPWRGPEGDLLGTFGVSGDVTKLVETRNKLSEITEALAKQNEAMEDELRLAREIQQAAVPKSLPTVSRGGMKADFHHIYEPASDLAGDFLEVMPLGEPEEGKAGFLVCDVMGHGVRAALIVSMLRGLIEKQRDSAMEPGKFLTELNDGLSHLLERTGLTMFSTAFYGVVDLEAGEVRLSSAGHPSPLLKINGEVSVLKFDSGVTGPALGMLSGLPYGEQIISLDGLQGVWAFTDGVFEVQGADGEEFETDRMAKVLAQDLGGAELVSQVVKTAREFSVAGEFDDDVCLLGVEFFGEA